ncbi:MAG: NapC/NirT family cytochrome c [Fidelibacterota bacterium]
MIQKSIKKLAFITLVAVLVLIVLLWSTIEYTSRPGFCTTCHFMEPYFQTWQASAHRDITCTDCHFAPGFKSKMKGKFTALSMVVNYMTGIYKKSKPWAEITDESCLRSGCHSERLLKGKVLFKEEIIFNHKPHLTKLRRGKNLRCTSCHSQIVQGEHISVTESTCFLCHFKKSDITKPINDCTQCHEAPVLTENSTNVKYDHTFVKRNQVDCQKCHGGMQVGDGVAPKERCSSCHAVVAVINRFDEVDFIHKKHVTDHKVECQTCHLVIQHKSVARTADIEPDCNSCHESQHIEQLTLFIGKSAHGDFDQPNPMFEAGLNCKACHIFHKYEGGVAGLSQATIAKGESCERCHGKGYAKLYRRWEEIMQKKVNTIGQQIQAAKEIISKAGSSRESLFKANQTLEKAVFNYQLVKRGNIVHNVAFSDRLLTEAADSINKTMVEVGSDKKFPDMSVYSEMIPSQCKNCHYGQEEITVSAFGIQFPHSIHIVEQGLPCTKCHSNYQRHGETIISKRECLQCHHTQETVACEDCHSLQAQVYSGTVDFASAVQPDVMSTEEVECRSCHGGDESPVRKAMGVDCAQCHEESYVDLLDEWQSQTSQVLSELTMNLSNDTSAVLYAKNKEVLDQIRYGVDRITADRSLGAHNIALITGKLQEYREIIQRMLE